MNNEEFPRLTGKEFRFIRQMSGLSMSKLARISGVGSRSTISNWELYQDFMKPFQVLMLLNAVPRDVFDESRRLWLKKQEEEELEKLKRKTSWTVHRR